MCDVPIVLDRMFWKYSRNDSKVLLLATLLVFSAYALMLWSDLRDIREREREGAQAIGVLASVPENELSTAASQLEERARALDAREALLIEAEQSGDRKTITLVAVAGGVLLGLILLNFYFDHVRRRSFR